MFWQDSTICFSISVAPTCMWNIQPEGTVEVTLYFTQFETEAERDKVKIYDAVSNELLETYSGIYEAGDLPEPVTSESGKMLIAFLFATASFPQTFLAYQLFLTGLT